MLRVENLTKKFAEKIALKNISFEVKPGVITGLLGPNGAGKTTTMRLLSGFLSPSSGSIQYKNYQVPRDIEFIQARLGYLPESAPLYPDMLVGEYLEYIANIRGMNSQSIPSSIEKMVELCELKDHFTTPISYLSKGFKQRVALAGTLIHDPELIILDEPTSGLDPNQISHIRNLIKSLAKDRTLILSTHILQEVEDICDDVIIINSSRIVANSRVRDLHRGNQIFVSIKGEKNVIQKFLSEYEISDLIENSQVDNGFMDYIINRDGLLPEMVYQNLKKTSLEVREIRNQKKSLESIFEELTRGES